MKCPNCQETLLMTERLGVEVDYCPKCRGIWLDKGELDKLLDLAAEQMPRKEQKSEPQPQYQPKEQYNQYPQYPKQGYYPKKKKSFLSDFLDFD